MRLALFQPDQPGNTGTLIRLCACLGVPVDIIEPCGFPFSVPALRRAGLDYVPQALIAHHASFDAFQTCMAGRLVLLTTKGASVYTDHVFADTDILMLGQESAGVPDHIHNLAAARIKIPMVPGMRSINVALAGAMVLGEALRQTIGFESTGETK